MIYERHFLSACWPEISGEDYEYLKDSIAISGLRDAITLYEGQILDGWNRYRACLESVIEPHFVEFEGDDAAQFVDDKHNRRSLTLTQRMTCIAKMATWAKVGKPSNSAPGALLTKREDLAKKTGGSVRTAQQVMNVVKSGNEKAIQDMVDGKLSAKKAEAQLKNKPLPKPAKPAPKPEVADEEGAPDQAEFDSVAAAHKADEDNMLKLLESDAPLAAMTAECKRLNILVEQLNWRNTGLQNEKNAAISMVKSLQRKLAKLEQPA